MTLLGTLSDAQNTPKVAYALLGASQYPDRVINYLLQLRFASERPQKQHEEEECPLCGNRTDRDHKIKCDVSRKFRNDRHNGVVNALILALAEERNAMPLLLDNG